MPPVAAPVGPGCRAEPVGHPVPGRDLAGQDAGARGAADLAGRVRLSEARAGGRDAVDVRAFVVAAAAGAQVVPAQVVGQDEQDVGVRPCHVPSTAGRCATG